MTRLMVDGLQVHQLPRVYAPAGDTDVVLSWLREAQPDGDMLEVCAGTGTISLAAARTAASVTAVDRCPSAVANIRLNATVNQSDVRVHCGDLFSPVAGLQFDTILANPPYMPTPATGGGPRSHTWDAGWDGRDILDRLATEAAAHLRPGGMVLLVQSVFADDERTATLLAESGLVVTARDRRVQPLGPVSRARTEHLAAIGVLDPTAPADELVLLEGRRP